MEGEKKSFFRSWMDKLSGAEKDDHNTPAAVEDVQEELPEKAQQEIAPAEEERDVPSKGILGALKEKLSFGLPAPEGTEEDKPSFFERLKRGLSKTHDNFIGRIDSLLLGKKQIDADVLEELEEILITADIGVSTTVDLVRTLEQRLKRNELKDGDALKAALKEEILVRLQVDAPDFNLEVSKPAVIMVIGVNGVGKTTTIGKLASLYHARGKKVVLAAADTFRAAAAEQLEIWGERAGVDVVRHKEGADPSAVAFDACKAALARKADIVIIDTAGRLHTKVNLMEELKKIRRVINREIPGAPHETLLILDAATGQNAVSQAKIFKEAADVTGIVLTKVDGTAKGGIVVAITNEFGIPIRYIGVGETVDDLREFNPDEFVEALF